MPMLKMMAFVAVAVVSMLTLLLLKLAWAQPQIAAQPRGVARGSH